MFFSFKWGKVGWGAFSCSFGVYVDGVLEKLKESGRGCKVGSKLCCRVGFTDDFLFINRHYICLDEDCKYR